MICFKIYITLSVIKDTFANTNWQTMQITMNNMKSEIRAHHIYFQMMDLAYDHVNM